VILYGTPYWSGLVEWMRSELVPNFIDGEDLDVFRLVDSPQHAVELVKEGVKRHWWHPQDPELAALVANGAAHQKTPMSGSRAASDTGEGTRYGKRPKRPEKPHAAEPRKPQQ